MAKVPESIRSEGKRIAAMLGETDGRAKWMIILLVREFGTEFIEELAKLAVAIQEAGGMKHLDGVHQRTLGGIFFRLTKDKITLKRWVKVIPKNARLGPPSPLVPAQQVTSATG